MFVALNFIRSALIFFISFLLLSSAQQAVQLYSLENMRVSMSESLNINLYQMVAGANVTFFINGNYTPPLPTDGIKIFQNYYLEYNYSKGFSSDQQQSYGGLQLDEIRNYLYTLDNNNVTIWDMKFFPTPPTVNSFKIPNLPKDTEIVQCDLFNFNISGSLKFYVFTTDYKGTTVTIRVTDVTDVNNPAFITSLNTFRALPGFKRVSYYQDPNYVWAFIYTQTDIWVFRFDLIQANSTFMYSINATSMNLADMTPSSIVFFANQAYYCDQTIGIYTMDLTYINSSTFNMPVVNSQVDPQSMGNLVSCTLHGSTLTVDTDGGTVLYSLPTYKQIVEYPHYSQFNTSDLYGMSSNDDFTVGWVFSQQAGSPQRESIRIFGRKMNFLSSLLIDVDIDYFLNGDSSNDNPAFLIYTTPALKSTYIIMNAASSLIIVRIEDGSTLVFPPQDVPYNYTGSLIGSDGNANYSYLVSLQGVSNNSTVIFNGRGNYQGQGYENPTSISNYAIITSDSYESYIPTRNYFSGPNVTYELTVVGGDTGSVNLTITTPPKWQLAKTYPLVNQGLDFSSFEVIQLGNGQDMLINLNGNSMILIFCVNLSIVNTLTYTFDSSLTPSLVTATMISTTYIIVESSGINGAGHYFIEWDVFRFDSNSLTIVKSIVINDREPSSEILLTALSFISLSGNSIDLYFFNTSSTDYLTYNCSVNSYSILPQIKFTPISFYTHDLILYVYDYYLGLMYMKVINSTSVTYQTASISLPQSFDVDIQGDKNQLYVTAQLFNQSTIYEFFYNLSFITTRAKVNCDNPNFFTVSNFFSSQVCYSSSMFYFQIFDSDESSYESLYTEIYASDIGYFGLGSNISAQALAGYYTDGKTLMIYSIGQLGDSSFNPTYPINIQPNSDGSQPFWSKISIKFTSKYFKPTYTFYFLLRAYNAYALEQTTITYSLINSGNYIQKNTKTFNQSDSNYTFGGISLVKQSFTAPIPTNAFSGNDVYYSFQVNNTLSGVHPATEWCNDTSKQFCLENKTYTIATFDGNFTYFDTWQNLIAATNNTHVMLYRWDYTNLTLLKAINASVLSPKTRCYRLVYLNITNSIAVACETNKSTGIYPFVTVLDINLNQIVDIYYVSYEIQFLKSSPNNGADWLYYYESTEITIFQVDKSNSSATYPYSFTLISHISQNTLFANTPLYSFTAISFSPIDMYYYKGNIMIVIDENKGIMIIQPKNYAIPYNYRIGYILTPNSEIVQVQQSTIVSAAYDPSGSGIILLAMRTADVYKCLLYPYPRCTVHFPMINGGYIPRIKNCGLVPESTMMIFPYMNNGRGSLRFLNYSADIDSAIYKDRYSGLYRNNTYNQRLVISSYYKNTVIYNFNDIGDFDTGGALHLIGFRLQPMGYIRKMNPGFNGTISLVGQIGSGSGVLQYSPVQYYYKSKSIPSSSTENPYTAHRYRSSWNTWYFWLILGLFSLVLVASLISVYVCVSKRRSRLPSHLSIGMTTLNP